MSYKKQRIELNEGSLNMEENHCVACNPTICNGIMRSKRNHPPAHYLLKVKSYSSLALSKVERYESGVFDAGGYNWKIVFYPHGKNKDNWDRHISLYLGIAETEKLPAGWEVLVHFKFFVHDQINDKYLIIQDAKEELKRFFPSKTEWGFEEMLLMDTFKNIDNGYLVDDCCLFGAEVFVVQRTGQWECLTTLKAPVNGTYTWKLNKFSQIVAEHYDSESFTVEGSKWVLRVYPRGVSRANNEWLSVFLVLKDETLPSSEKWYAEYTVRVKNQIQSGYIEHNAISWFTTSDSTFGWHKFASLKDLKKADYAWNDSLIVECQFTVLSKFEHFK